MVIIGGNMKFIYPVGAFEKVKNKDVANGYAGLDENTKLAFNEVDSADFESYILNKNLLFGMVLFTTGGG